MSAPLEKECCVCGATFTKGPSCSIKRWKSKRRFCSVRCKGIASQGSTPHNKAAIAKWCIICGAKFEVSPYRAVTAQFCSRSCLGRTKVNDKAPNWRGGITPINFRIRNSEEYKKWRMTVFQRDNFTCQMCGARGVRLQADHKKLFSAFPKLRFDSDNGQSLCEPCHLSKTRKDLKRGWRNQFGESPLRMENS